MMTFPAIKLLFQPCLIARESIPWPYPHIFCLNLIQFPPIKPQLNPMKSHQIPNSLEISLNKSQIHRSKNKNHHEIPIKSRFSHSHLASDPSDPSRAAALVVSPQDGHVGRRTGRRIAGVGASAATVPGGSWIIGIWECPWGYHWTNVIYFNLDGST